MRVIGIDLGTTNSAAAVGGRELRVLQTPFNRPLTPSVVSYVGSRDRPGEGEVIAGEAAFNNWQRDPLNTVHSIKRLMGRVHGEKWAVYGGQMDVDDVRKKVSYRIAEAPPEGAPDQRVKVLLGPGTYTPVEISAMILKRIKADAEKALGADVGGAVITIPAYFNEKQRHATLEAGELAGLKVMELLDEPTAAALAFGLGREAERHRVLVYDLGGGTFDISIIQMTAGKYAQMVIEGDNWLGGDDFDELILARILDVVRETHEELCEDKVFLAWARKEARYAKEQMTGQERVKIDMMPKLPGGLGHADIHVEVARPQFEADIRPLVERSLGLVRKALAANNMEPQHISEVLLVGGSTSVPAVHKAVAELFAASQVRRDINPMECVALGAAVRAAEYERQAQPAAAASAAPPVSTLKQVTPMHLGIAAAEGSNADVFFPIIPKGTPYPLAQPKSQVFYPTQDAQKVIRVPVYEGLNEKASLNDLQGEIVFPLPEGVPASTPVEVTFDYDKNRTLKVGVRLRVSGAERFKEEVLQHGMAPARPAGPTLLDDWREELQSSIRAARFFLATYGEYVKGPDRQEIEKLIVQGEEARERKNQVNGVRILHALRDKILDSGVGSYLFLAERMMHGAPPDMSRAMVDKVSKLRDAFRKEDSDGIERLCEEIRVLGAQIASQQTGRVEDARDLKGLLRKWK